MIEIELIGLIVILSLAVLINIFNYIKSINLNDYKLIDKIYTDFIEVRNDHKGYFVFWDVIDYQEAWWSTRDGFDFAYFYFVQHKLFKKLKRVQCYGYRAKDHCDYKIFHKKHLNSKL